MVQVVFFCLESPQHVLNNCSIKLNLNSIYMYLPIKDINWLENLPSSGMVKLPDCIANVLSPNGREKKHNLYNKHPNACQKKNQQHIIQ